MAKKNGHAVRGPLKLYRSYMFIKKNPEIDRFRTIFQDEGISEAQLHVLSGVSVTTFANWFRGDTRSPQHATMAAAYGALGYELTPTKVKKIDYESELPKAQKWLDSQAAQKAKKA